MDIDIEKLQVADLKREPDARGEDSRGSKAVLKQRLSQVLKEESYQKKIELQPKGVSEQRKDVESRSQGDVDARSIKTTSSRGSVASQRAVEAARRAGLIAKMDALKQKHELEAQIEHLRRKQEQMQLVADLKESEAKDSVLAQFEADETKQDPHERKEITRPADHTAQQVDLSTSDRVVMRRIGLQPLELRAFDGTEEDFLPFITAFESNIACKLDKEEEKLM